MKYTFINENNKEQTVVIPDEYIKKNRAALGISNKEAILMYLSDEGYIENAEIAELTAKAKENKVGVAGERKQRKAPVRKPDEVKRAIINHLFDSIMHTDVAVIGNAHDIEITNPERIIAFSIGTDKYEITLSKKRAPKK